MNELILISALIFIYGTILLSYRLFGKSGLYCMSVLATILANIEVVILIRAFGIEQTLGNVLFASTFLITDILSECEGRKSANKAVLLGIFSAIFFLILTQAGAYTKQAKMTPCKKLPYNFSPILPASSLLLSSLTSSVNFSIYGCIIHGGNLQKQNPDLTKNSYGCVTMAPLSSVNSSTPLSLLFLLSQAPTHCQSY